MSFYEDVKELAGLKEDDEVTGIIIVLIFALLFVPALLGVFNFLGGETDTLLEEATGVVEELDADEFDTLAVEEPAVMDADPVAVEAEAEVAPTAVPTQQPDPTAVPTAEAMEKVVPTYEPSTIDYVSRTETDITLKGVASAGETITLLDNGATAGSVVADEAGNWQITVPFNQSIKEHIYEAQGLSDATHSVKYLIAE